MAIGNSVNDEIREQKAKMKDKPFKEKLAYFWEYYKVHTIVIILSAAILGNLIYTIATRKDVAMTAAFVNTFLTEDLDKAQMAADFTSYAGYDPEEYETFLEAGMNVDYDVMSDITAANIQKIMAMVSAQSLDVIIANDLYVEHSKDTGMFGDLTLYFPEDMLAQYAAEDRLIYADLEDDDKGEVPIAIDIKDSKYFMSHEAPAWFIIVSNTKHPETALKFWDFMMEPEA